MREQRHDGDEAEEQAVAAGDADTEVEVPRQEQRDDEQHDRDPVAHRVGAGGHVADAGRPARRRARRHVVTLVAHVTISSLSDDRGVATQGAHFCSRAQATRVGRRGCERVDRWT